MTYETRDNEFIAWYPCALQPGDGSVWAERPSAFYVHIPFCEAICDYCGFSVAKLKGSPVDTYVDHVVRELQMYREAGRFAGRRFDVGSFGGGTPSTLTPEQFLKIAAEIRKGMAISEAAEITVEANPLSLTQEKIEAYKEAGVNRLSLGVQSFDEKSLRTVGRPHRYKDIVRSLELVHGSGIPNFSLDFMYGIPGQSLDDLKNDLREAAATGAPHLSCFRLEIIPFTRLSLRRGAGLLPPSPDMAQERHIEETIVDVLQQHGYRRYGVFNFAKPGYECLHNSMVFSPPQRDFFGFGNSSSSFVNDTSYCNYTRIDDYIQAIDEGRVPISHARKATTLELMSRIFVLGLKMEGVRKSDFENVHGIAPEAVFGPIIERLLSAGLLQFVDETYSLTGEGRFYVNNVCKEFYVLDNIGHSQHSFSFVPTINLGDVELFRRKSDKAKIAPAAAE